MNNADESRDIRAAERALYRAMIAKDYAALDKILAPGLVYVHSTAVAESKPEYLAGVKKGLYEYASIESREAAIAVHGDCAVMHGIVDMSVSAAGRPKETTHLLFVLVWVKEAGAWLLDYRQATRIP